MEALALVFYSLIGIQSGTNQNLSHNVIPTKMVKNGSLHIASGANRGGRTNVNIRYDLKTRWYAPVGDQKGSVNQTLPTKYLYESGYRELQRKGSDRFEGVTITHLGRVNFDSYRNGHLIKVQRNDNKWSFVAHYHQEIHATGWGKLELTLNEVPVLGSYTLNSVKR